MSPSASNVRLATYVNAAILSAFMGGVLDLDTSDWRKVAVFVASIFLAGNNALRAYIDKSPSEVRSRPILPDGLPGPNYPPMP